MIICPRIDVYNSIDLWRDSREQLFNLFNLATLKRKAS